MRNILMGVEVMLAMVVLVAAAFFFRNFRETRETDPGFRRDGVLLAAYDLSGRNLDDSSARVFPARLLDRLRTMPAVETAAIAAYVPLDIHALPLRPFTLEGRVRSDAAPNQALLNVVTPAYFRTMDIPFREGRDFTDLNDATAVPQAIANEEFVRRYVGRAQTIGRSLQSGRRSYVIAGVVRNSLYDSFGEPPIPIIYFSYRDLLCLVDKYIYALAPALK